MLATVLIKSMDVGHTPWGKQGQGRPCLGHSSEETGVLFKHTCHQ